MTGERKERLVLCIDNKEYPVSLEVFKTYRKIPTSSRGLGMICVVDETGEDYLYPKKNFLNYHFTVQVAKKGIAS